MTKHRLQLLAGVTVCTALIAAWTLRAQAQSEPAPQQTARPSVETPGRLRDPVKPFMDAKLSGTQDVLKGLLTRDFRKIAAAAESLSNVALTSPPREVIEELDAEVYEHFQIEFMRHSSKLRSMAEAENLEGAAYVHRNLTSACIACHEYLRDRELPSGVIPAGQGSSTAKKHGKWIR